MYVVPGVQPVRVLLISGNPGGLPIRLHRLATAARRVDRDERSLHLDAGLAWRTLRFNERGTRKGWLCVGCDATREEEDAQCGFQSRGFEVSNSVEFPSQASSQVRRRWTTTLRFP